MKKFKAQYKYPRRHYSESFFNIVKVLFVLFTEIIFSLFQIWNLRSFYKKHNCKVNIKPRIILVGDNFDEVNGIALHVRLLIRLFKKTNREIYAVGITYHSNKPRMEQRGRLLLAPGKVSINQPGYSESESAIPYLKFLLRLMRRYPVDLIEFETPGVFSIIMLIVAKMVGIKTVHHYRTDALYYIQTLVKNRIGAWIACQAVIFFIRRAGGIIIPSETMRSRVEKIKSSKDKITYIVRGVDTNRFSPTHKNQGVWEKKVTSNSGFRLLYMGRISEEKNLSILKTILPNILRKNIDFQFCFVGHGPYKKNLEHFFRKEDRVFFTGMMQGQDLTKIMADADLFIFPSHTDTFGNAVAEALASGLPCIVSNRGGPSGIIEHGKSGFICNYKNPMEFQEKIFWFFNNPEQLREFKLEARKLAKKMTHKKSVENFWNFYEEQLAAK